MPTKTRFQEIKRYVRLDERDGQLLRAFGALVAPEFPRIASEFYDRIREHEDAHAVFTGEEQIQRLQRSLVAWLTRVCGGTYDEAYYEQTVGDWARARTHRAPTALHADRHGVDSRRAVADG